MDKFDQWGKTYPSFLREFAKFLASTPHLLEQSYTWDFIRSACSDESLYPSVKQWLGYYRNHKWLNSGYTWAMLSPQNSGHPLSKELIHGFQRHVENNGMSPDDLYQMLEIDDPESKALVEKYYSAGCAELSQGHDFDQKELEIPSPEVLFIYKVTLPCFLFYGDFPGVLYRKARNADVDAMCKLLRIDKRIIADHRIADAINTASLKSQSDNFRKICRAFSQNIEFPSRPKFKTHLAGFIKKYFKNAGIDIKAPDIQTLFDAAHAHYHPKFIEDPDIPGTPESFRKAMKRKAARLKNI